MTSTTIPASSAPPGSASDAREDRMVRILDRASGRLRLAFTERTLFAVGGALAVAGVVCVLVGWEGTSRTVLVSGQIPYLVSGGLLGLGLIFLGGFLYFGHWMALMVRDNRERAAEDRNDLARIREHLDHLNQTVAGLVGVLAPTPSISAGGGPARAPRTTAAAGDPIPSGAVLGGPAALALVATPSGTMMHLPDCAAVTGRENLRTVTPADGLRPCGLCRPLDPVEP